MKGSQDSYNDHRNIYFCRDLFEGRNPRMFPWEAIYVGQVGDREERMTEGCFTPGQTETVPMPRIYSQEGHRLLLLAAQEQLLSQAGAFQV